ncbi:MAG: hypothetical protein LKM31_15925 [Sphingobium sp.]|nr:hypothetical protein [Sphingobium sp.]
MTKTIMIGVDLAKNVIQLHAARMTGEVEYRKQLSREKFRRFMAEQPPALVVMEACGSANYWSRPSRWCNFGCGRGPSSGGFGGDV